jgi:hypothetical protein
VKSLCCSVHGLSPLTCSGSELTSKIVNRFRPVIRTPWMGDRPIARSVPIQDNTTQTRIHSHPSSGIRTHIPSFRAVQDHTRSLGSSSSYLALRDIKNEVRYRIKWFHNLRYLKHFRCDMPYMRRDTKELHVCICSVRTVIAQSV